MRKILTIILLAFGLIITSKTYAANQINFIYINGSNNNDKKMETWFKKGVKNLHPKMKKSFEKDKFTQKYFLDGGIYSINNEPTIFFWGYKSENDLKFVKKDLEISKVFSTWGAYVVRSMLTSFFHDAIWVQKYHNMHGILDDLQKVVKKSAENGDKVVLFGYSAGSFINYEYMLSRFPYIDVYDFFNKLGASKDTLKFIQDNPMQNTCVEALGTSKLATASITGHLVQNNNDELFKKNYLNLDEETQRVCAPVGSVEGIVNFASPLILFYSDISEPNYELSYYNVLLIKYLIENDKFWITVNFREDPLGFPCGKNISVEEIEKLTNMNIDPHKGFIYDNSGTTSLRPVFLAHTSYWSARKAFSRAVIKAYKDGYSYHSDDIDSPYKKKYRK